ncbi:MAG: hypothetical protein U0744_03455 [Gemmataceae bacterium]
MIRSSPRHAKRQGVVLLIVMAMLALFAGVALSFVFFAEGEATLARTARDAERSFAPDTDPEMLLSYFLSQLIYDSSDSTGVYSALRGHSLVRNLYGYNSTTTNTTPHNGSGRLSYQVTLGTLGNADNKTLINYQYHPNDSFLRDPERQGTRGSVSVPVTAPFLGELNPSYTYPDLNNVYLGAVNAKGEVLRQSFYRPETGGALVSANQVDRYKVLRPHPSYHTQFPQPEDGGGDVKNLDWALGVPNGASYFMNDSYWIDAGYPVITAADGRKYKPLFAPFVMDLDNRLNLMVAGNYNTTANKSVSNQGLGRFELNLAPLDGAGKSRIISAGAGGDLAGVFRSAAKSRYGSDTLPDAAAAVTTNTAPYYSMFDFDFDTSASGTPSNWQLPTSGSFSMFPTYPATWKSGVGETTGHPAGYSYWFPTGANNDLRPLAAQNMEALLRFGGKNSPALTSDLWAILPSTLTPNQANYNAKARNLLTTLSMSFDRPHIPPYITYNPSTSTVYKFDNTVGYPKAQSALTTPDPTTTPADVNSEFGNGTAADYRSMLASRFPRLDLNRKLTDYPLPDVNTGTFALATDGAQFQAAFGERHQFAKDIFARLLDVTGASKNLTAFATTDPEYLAVRNLAQIAVNIVDYIDNDDYMTPFDWKGDQTEILFGTEMQRLVLNEVYVQYDNDPKENGVKNKTFGTDLNALKYRMCVWFELHNPLSAPPVGAAYPRDNGKAVLCHVNNEAIYRVHVLKANANIWADDNLRGDPNVADIIKGKDQTGTNDVTMTVSAWGANAMVSTDREVLPGAGAFNDAAKTNNGFFSAGPDVGAADRFVMNRDPGLPVTFSSPNLVTYFDLPLATQRPTVVLQRLANEHLPYKDAPGQPDHNPYITIDYLKNVQVNDQLKYDGMADHNPADITTMTSQGRRQPMSALNVTAQNPSTPVANQPKHTFFQQNCIESAAPMNAGAAGQTMDGQFEWVTQLDRPLINPLELVHVSTYRPSELTQRIVSGNGGQPGNQKHADAWMDSSSLLYRFLELTTTKDRMVGNQLDGRVPGKININTVWDDEIFQALTDPQSWSNYDINKSSQIFNAMKLARDGNASMITTPAPILPLGAGLNGTSQLSFAGPGGVTTNPAFLTQNASGVNLTHRYQQMELLRKIHNNVTTTSNCFAVWVTVGFFEVTDDSVKPAKLGEEIGRRENRHLRHRFFAIVDRSEIAIFRDATISNASLVAMTTNKYQVTLPTSVTSPFGKSLAFGTDIALQQGMVLEVGTGANMEVVRIESAAANTFTATFNASPAGKTVTLRGNPGPMTRYDVRRDPQVVPHYTVID